jgi:two-component system chemotaxis response regulator CheB
VPEGNPRVVGIGASAGGVEALRHLMALLPADLGVAVVVVLHLPPNSHSVLPQILSRAGDLRAVHAEDGEAVVAGRVYVAPPDHHLTVADGVLRLDRGPRVNGHRPAIDRLLRSLVVPADGPVAAVLLSGALDDGVEGLGEVLRAGGKTIVQDPSEAAYPSMPQTAIDAGVASQVLSVEGIAAAVVAWARTPGDPLTPAGGPPRRAAGGEGPLRAMPRGGTTEEGTTAEQLPPLTDLDRPGPNALYPGEPHGSLSGLTCPSCGGALWQDADTPTARYSCRTGHAFSPESLVHLQTEHVEEALWSAYRTLLEQADLSRRIARRMERAGLRDSADRHAQTARDGLRRAHVLRELLLSGEDPEEAGGHA